MNDDDLIAGFESCTLTEFPHRDHIRVVWLYLSRYSLLDTLVRFSTGLKRFASAHGQSDRYHETITWSYVFLIHERKVRDVPPRPWPDFVADNGDLFDWRHSILNSYYRDETLNSAVARRMFIFPDKAQPTR
jgi:hypothetical protein